MSVNVLYTTQATAIGGRDGRATTKDGSLDVKLTTPKKLGGPGGPGNNPDNCSQLDTLPASLVQ